MEEVKYCVCCGGSNIKELEVIYSLPNSGNIFYCKDCKLNIGILYVLKEEIDND